MLRKCTHKGTSLFSLGEKHTPLSSLGESVRLPTLSRLVPSTKSNRQQPEFDDLSRPTWEYASGCFSVCVARPIHQAHTSPLSGECVMARGDGGVLLLGRVLTGYSSFRALTLLL